MSRGLFAVIIASISSLVMAAPVGDISEHKTDVKHISNAVKDSLPGIQVTDPNFNNGQPKAKNALNKPQNFKTILEKTDSLMSHLAGVGEKTSDDVYVGYMYRMSGVAYTIGNWFGMPDHSGLGRISGKTLTDVGATFIGADTVLFGDWADVGVGAAKGTLGTNYTVLYGGDNSTVTMPSGGKAIYKVEGINQYNSWDTSAPYHAVNSPYTLKGGLLSGQFEANFAKSKLIGNMTGANGLAINIDAGIDSTNAKFTGTATASGREIATGITKGHFFGEDAAGLAGVADFGQNNDANTSFGGYVTVRPD